eukprot:m.20928 g.20928  ORF g.20928 m.20928 type:complete len:697 (-) comp8642_c0_seq1:84-2174(-)
MMKLTSCVVVALAVVVVGLGAFVDGAALNKNIKHYESIRIEQEHVMRQGRYVRSMFRHDKPFSFKMSAYEREFTFHLTPNTELFTETFVIAAFNGNEREDVYIDDRTYYKGSVNRNASTSCHFRVANDGSVHGHFSHEGEKYQVDPASFHESVEEDSPADHVVYRLSDHINADVNIPAHCGVSDTTSMLDGLDTEEYSRNRRAGTPFQTGMTVCDVAFYADSLFFDSIGAGSQSRTIDIMTARFASVKEVYEERNDVADQGTGAKIAIRIGYFEIQQDSNNDPYNPQNFNGDGNAYLRHFSTDPNAATSGKALEDYCVGHILTYQDFDSGLLGLAWVGTTGSSPGGICQTSATLSGQTLTTNTGFSTQINFGVDVPELTTYLVMSHEMGHNFGSNHDDTSGDRYLMYPVSVDGSSSVNYEFSSQSLTTIGGVISAKGGCFISPTTSACGNLVQEDTEPCDCGTDASLCAGIDACCQTGCMLASGAACSPRHSENGACCSSGCQIQTGIECRPEAACTEASTCDGSGNCPTPANKADWTGCTATNSRVCNTGNCNTTICSAWGLEQNNTVLGSCLIYCGAMTTSNLGMPMNAPLDSSGMALDLSSDILKAPGEECLMNDGMIGICSDMGMCVESDQNIFDDIKAFLANFSLDSLKDWFFRTDAVIPNYGWLAVGLGVLILLITLCCCISNKMDNKVI